MTHTEHITPVAKIKFKTSTLKSSSWDYSDACILVTRNITVVVIGATEVLMLRDRANKQAIFRNFMPFAECISEMDNGK